MESFLVRRDQTEEENRRGTGPADTGRREARRGSIPMLLLGLAAAGLITVSVVTGLMHRPSFIKGKALQPGDCIGVTAPGFFIQDDDFGESIKILEEAGYRVKLAPSCTSHEGYLAGSDQIRAKDINDLFADDEVDAILCLRGGYGSVRVLGRLNYDMIAAHPKLLIGYSDVTALQAALLERSGLVTAYGPMITSLKPDMKEYTLEQFLDGLSGKVPAGEIVLPEEGELKTLAPGKAEGYLTGGNLSVVASLVGTEYELQGNGALLILEEVGEPPYKVDRMLRQLYDSGLFDRVNGICFGEFVDCEDTRGRALTDVLEEYAALSGKPVIMGVPSGHDRDNMFLPFGVRAVMTGRTDGSASLVIEEAAVE